jgi:hypothetical protein
MMSTFDKLVTGITAVAIITALGLHAADLAKLSSSAGTATSQLMSTAEKG